MFRLLADGATPRRFDGTNAVGAKAAAVAVREAKTANFMFRIRSNESEDE
jgi:hypothetical protein